MNALHPTIEVKGEYVTSQTRIDCHCTVCGYEWSPKPNGLLNGHGCPKCAGRAKKTDAEFRAEASKVAPTIEVLEPYKGTMVKLECECSICGHRWKVTPNHLLRGSGCPKCGGNHKRNTSEFIHDLRSANPSVELIGVYVDTQTKTLFRCTDCGHEWSAKPIRLLRGDRGCPACGLERVKDKLRSSQEDFEAQLATINPSITVLGKYVNRKQHIRCRCEHCGNEWDASPYALLNGTGCPCCNHTSTSFAEQFILAYLKRMLGDSSVLSRDRLLIGMELDILVPEKHFAVEIGSWYWHADKANRDEQKQRLCRNHSVRLITVYDAFPAGLNRPDLSDCIVYEGSLGELKNRAALQDLAIKLARELGVQGNLTEEAWASIAETAYIESRSKTTATYAEELAYINPDVMIIGEYKGSQVKIRCRCRTCGHEWETKPANLSQGRGCPECGLRRAAERQRKSHDTFVDELHAVNPSIEVLGEYVNNKTPIECVCADCGYAWNGIPSSLLSGSGCPRCAGNMQKTHDVFVRQMQERHPTVRVLGTYSNSNEKVRCQCLTCGCVWDGVPAMMLSAGTGCPDCGRIRTTKKLRKTPEAFLAELAEINPDIEPISQYVNSTTKVRCRCKVCGCVWSAMPGSLLRRHGCPDCARATRALKQTKTESRFFEELASINPLIKPIGSYTGSSEKIECECLKCGYRWHPIASNLLNGAGCPKCAGKARKTTSQFIEELGSKNPSIEVVGEYVSSKDKIKCRCRACGHLWSATPNNLLRGTGCPSCARKMKSSKN